MHVDASVDASTGEGVDTSVDASLTAAGEYLFSVAHSLSASLSNFDKKAAKGKTGAKAGAPPPQRPNQINVYVVTQFPDWKVGSTQSPPITTKGQRARFQG